MRSVEGSTRVYAVVGHPVAHSLSPRMQNAALDAAGRNAVYVALDVPPDRLDRALEGLHAAGVAGLNVTLPHKEAAFARLVRASRDARDAGAANTLRWSADGWEGHATDGIGFDAWLDELGIDPRGRRALLFGAGGAARSVAPALARRGVASLDVVSRTAARARALAAWLHAAMPAGARLDAGSLAEPPGAGGAWDLLVRAVSVERVEPPEERLWRGLSASAPVLDLNYGARAAAVLAHAEREGRRAIDGLGLLVHQGAASFEYWNGTEAPIAAMRAAVGL
ncbi:MAG TPA: shikimate dehydrogenase [Candidatus Eisenbacteria bacterium]